MQAAYVQRAIGLVPEKDEIGACCSIVVDLFNHVMPKCGIDCITPADLAAVMSAVILALPMGEVQPVMGDMVAALEAQELRLEWFESRVPELTEVAIKTLAIDLISYFAKTYC